MSLKKGILLFVLCSVVLFSFYKPKIRIGIISDSKYCGERELGWRIKIAAENLGWVAFLDEHRGSDLKKIKNLDWVICLIPDNRRFYHNSSQFLTVFHPFNYLEPEGTLRPFYEKYDGYLLTIKQPDAFERSFQSKNRRLFSLPFYPSLQYVEYKEVALDSLMTMIPVWGDRLIDEKFKKVYKALSREGFTKFYGIHPNSDIIENGYMGKIPFDGTSVIDILQKHGIVLIFHSQIHNQEEIPSSRIFEAAAASTVIISDTNGFVKKHFGDTVFYVDTSLPAEDIYLQIKNHVAAIRQDPKMALEMAKKAHQIYVDRFLMTDQLLKIHSMHTEIQKYKAKCILDPYCLSSF